jgi:hypothetical protein
MTLHTPGDDEEEHYVDVDEEEPAENRPQSEKSNRIFHHSFQHCFLQRKMNMMHRRENLNLQMQIKPHFGN